MTNVEIQELVETLEKIRSEKYPELPASLIQKIIYAEFSSQDDREKGRRDTQKIMDDFLKTIAV